MSDDKMIKFGKDGKPTDETMEYLFKHDRDKFLEFQDKYMTTKGTMGDNVFKDIIQKVMGKSKGDKK